MQQLIGVIFLLALVSVSTLASCDDKGPLECPVSVSDWYEQHGEFRGGCHVDSDCIVPRVRSPSCLCGGVAYIKDRIEEVEAIYSCIDCDGVSIPLCPEQTNECINSLCVSKDIPQP